MLMKFFDTTNYANAFIRNFLFCAEHITMDPFAKEVVSAAIRLEYLKLAIIVILLVIIVWFYYNRCAPSAQNVQAVQPATEKLEPVKSLPLSPVGKTGRGAILANDSGMHKKKWWQLAMFGKSNDKAEPGEEDFAPYASWLTPDIYLSDPAHDEHRSNKSHYGMYAPYDLNYLFPNNIDVSGQAEQTEQAGQTEQAERLTTLTQPGLTSDDIASENDVPEKELESESGLLFGLSNYDTLPVSGHGVL
jgi:hypothetical protein